MQAKINYLGEIEMEMVNAALRPYYDEIERWMRHFADDAYLFDLLKAEFNRIFWACS